MSNPAYDPFNQPSAVVGMELLGGVLVVAEQIAEEYLREHPPGCGCGYEHVCQELRGDMLAVQYGCRAFRACLLSLCGGTPHLPGESFADDLNRLSNFATRWEDWAPDADEPIVAEGGAS